MKIPQWMPMLILLVAWTSAQATTKVTTVTYVYTDASGNVVMKADSQGNIIARYDYRPYGTQQAGPSNAGPGYTGHVNDPDTGLVYMQARYYDPETGRFLSVDPVAPIPGNIFNFNDYQYANNNPVNLVDPTGRNACGNDDDTTCKVAVTFTSRTKGEDGAYNDKYAGLKGNGDYNALATVSVNGKTTGTFLARTTSSGTQFANIRNGTYNGILHYHHGNSNKPTIELMSGGSNHIPTTGPNPAQHGKNFATYVLTHNAGKTSSAFPLGFTGTYDNNRKGVSEACQLICSVEYHSFLTTTGLKPSDGSPPQRHFTVVVNTLENTTPGAVPIQ